MIEKPAAKGRASHRRHPKPPLAPGGGQSIGRTPLTATRSPTVTLERNASARAELYAFGLQRAALDEVAAGLFSDADFTAGVDHAVPRHPLLARVLIGKRAQRVAHLPRVTARAGERSNLAVRRDTPFRNASDDLVDAGVGHSPPPAAGVCADFVSLSVA